MKVSDGWGFAGDDDAADGDGWVVVVRGGCCGAVPQDSEPLLPDRGCCPPHEDNSKPRPQQPQRLLRYDVSLFNTSIGVTNPAGVSNPGPHDSRTNNQAPRAIAKNLIKS